MSRRNGGARAGRRGSTGGGPQPLVRFSAGTFTRSSEGSYYTQPIGGGAGSTFIAWAGSNLLRYDAIDNQPLALFEGSQSNLCPYSEDLNQAAWGKTGASISGTTGAAPDGASDLCTVDFTTSASDSIMQTISTGTADASTYLSTVFVRRTTGSGNIRFQLVNRAGVTSQSSDIAIDTTWRRIEWSSSWGTGATAPQIGLINGTAAAAQSVEVWGFDVKITTALNAPTSYIRTTATSATRSLDALTFGSAPARMATGKWSFACRPLYGTSDVVSARGAAFAFSSTEDDCINVFRDATQAINNGAIAYTRTGLSFSRNQALTITPDCGAFTLTVSGATAGDGTGAVGVDAAFGTAHLRIGSIFSGARQLYARIGEPYAAT
jgi:hypothetical protein